MTTCPTCGSPTDTHALAFLHGQFHAANVHSLATSQWATAATIMQAYADQAVANMRCQMNQWIENGCIPPPNKAALEKYLCCNCGQHGVKLWRKPHSSDDLQCAKCIAPTIAVDEDGQAKAEYGPMSDQVNDWLPAVPNRDGDYWGYTSVPPQAVGWWRTLPTYTESDEARQALAAKQ